MARPPVATLSRPRQAAMLRIMVTPRMPSGAGQLRLQDRARTHHHLVDRPLDAVVEDALGALAQQVGAEHHGRHRRAHQEVDRPRHLVVAGAGVERDALAVDLEAIAQLDGSVALAVAVDGVGEVVAALRDQRAQLAAQLALGLLDQPRRRRRRRGAAEALEQLGERAARPAGSPPSRRACRPSPSRGSASCDRRAAAAPRRSRPRAPPAPAAR